PTTLLSMVDSSVGGKTGVNHALGKNMIGAFYQPRCVIADTGLLETLPARELSAGIAEIVKYGLIADFAFFEWLEKNMPALMARDKSALAYAVERSCQIKAEVVAQDEREGGVRAILNLGHTFGHAIETAQGYGNWLHGEAVAAGMVMAADLSWRRGGISQAELDRTVALLQQARLPVKAPADMTDETFLSLMGVDKKVLDGRLRLVLLEGMGKAIVTSDVDGAVLAQRLAAGRWPKIFSSGLAGVGGNIVAECPVIADPDGRIGGRGSASKSEGYSDEGRLAVYRKRYGLAMDP